MMTIARFMGFAFSLFLLHHYAVRSVERISKLTRLDSTARRVHPSVRRELPTLSRYHQRVCALCAVSRYLVRALVAIQKRIWSVGRPQS